MSEYCECLQKNLIKFGNFVAKLAPAEIVENRQNITIFHDRFNVTCAFSTTSANANFATNFFCFLFKTKP